FYEAHVRAGRVMRLPEGKVRVEIVVEEGPPVTIGQVDIVWKDWRLEGSQSVALLRVTAAVTNIRNDLKLGSRFDEDTYEATKAKLKRAMTDRGYAYGSVEGTADVDLTQHKARVVFTLELGPPCTFGDVTLAGLGKIPEAPIR